jgi:hypothetical protein
VIDPLELSRGRHDVGMTRQAAQALTDRRATEEKRLATRIAAVERREDDKLAAREDRLTARMEAFHRRTPAGVGALLLTRLIVRRRLLAA